MLSYLSQCLLPQTFGLNCARCLTSPIDKQPLTILSRTGQSKDCTAASMMPFAHMATWSKELPFVLLRLRAQPREGTGLSPVQAVFGAPIVLPNEFCKMKKFLLILLVKIFLKPWMFLLFLCLGTILAPSCTASCQPNSSQPPLSGSGVAAWSHSLTAPTPFCAVASAPSPSESGHGMRSSLSAT